MRIVITVQKLINRGLWLKSCEVLGINPWSVNEDQLDLNDELKIESTQAFEIGLIGQSPREAIKMNDDYTIEAKES